MTFPICRATCRRSPSPWASSTKCAPGYHQALLAAAAEAAGGLAVPAALTFHPHPAAVFPIARAAAAHDARPARRFARAHGARVVAVARFDRTSPRRPRTSSWSVLVQRLRARVVVVGDDFRYGCNRAGDVVSLREAGQRHGFTLRVVPPLLVGGVPARSTVIRGMVGGGRGRGSGASAGPPVRAPGEVVLGRRLGRTGYPTANAAPPPDVLVPGHGRMPGASGCAAWRRAAISVGNLTDGRSGRDAHGRSLPAGRLFRRDLRRGRLGRVPRLPARGREVRHAGSAGRADGPRRRRNAAPRHAPLSGRDRMPISSSARVAAGVSRQDGFKRPR